MTDLARKLQLENDTLRVLGRPEGVAEDLPHAPVADGLLAFARTGADLDAAKAAIIESAKADRLTWVAFPKAGQLDTDLNRDRVAETLIAEGIRPVRNISIDEVWSALRFRPGG
ncbi:MAG: hypothetical protein KJP18_13975 [Gemmatimonadetes bacterium]|nr:hypothetical protein [Gemmatimonadota bacterium]